MGNQTALWYTVLWGSICLARYNGGAPQRGITEDSMRGLAIYIFGFIIGLLLLGGMAWANLEASFFDPWASLTADAKLESMTCPLLVTPGEKVTVQATLANPLDRPIRRLVRVHIPQRFITLLDEEETWLDFQPGEEKRLQWPVSTESGVYGGRFLMVSVYASGYTPIPAQEARCGIWVVPLPFLNGTAILVLGNLLAVAGMVGGLWLRRGLWRPGRRANRLDSGLQVLFLLYVVGMAALLIGRWWFISAAAAAFMIVIAATLLLRWAEDVWLREPGPQV
ncbi:MAG: hypothetical protein D6790_13875 [Caldilineae bacterium]|nr:MAG: hypothetical protein D6790_13875 [Caldilineae bacterium]